MVLGSLIGLGVGVVGGIAAGNFAFASVDKSFDTKSLSIFADKDDDVPMPEGADEHGNIAGKNRDFLTVAPQWALWPDYDRVLWMNHVLKTLWPYYNTAIKDIILETVKPQIADVVGKVPGLQAIDLEIIDLGTQPISLGGVKTYESNADQTVVETTAMWGSNARVRASARLGFGKLSLYVPVEVTDLQAKAAVRVTLSPLVETIPCMGRVAISLLDVPHVDLALRLIGGLDLMLVPGLAIAAQLAVQQILGSMMVYPNRMAFDIMEGGGIPPPPVGMLIVKVIKAAGIKSGDLLSKADPYLELEVRKGRSQATEIAHGKEPIWNETFSFIVDDPEKQALTVYLKEEDALDMSKEARGVAIVQFDDAEFLQRPREVVPVDVPFYKGEHANMIFKFAKAGVGAVGGVAKFTAGTALKVATLGKLGKKGEGQGDKAQRALPEVGRLFLEVQYCPFAATGAAAVANTKMAETMKNAADGGKKLQRTATAVGREHQAEVRKLSRGVTESAITESAKGVLSVTVIKCSALETADGSDVDPIVELTLDDPAKNNPETQRTSQMINEPNPRYGETFDFVNISATSTLNIVVWDKLNFFEGRFSIKGLTGRKETRRAIGRVRIDVPAVVRNERIKDSWALQDSQSGDLQLILSWQPVQLGGELAAMD